MEQQYEVNQLIIEIEQLDNRIVVLNTRRGMVDPDEVLVLKYRRCFLFDRLTQAINENPEEDDEKWGELK